MFYVQHPYMINFNEWMCCWCCIHRYWIIANNTVSIIRVQWHPHNSGETKVTNEQKASILQTFPTKKLCKSLQLSSDGFKQALCIFPPASCHDLFNMGLNLFKSCNPSMMNILHKELAVFRAVNLMPRI